MTIQEMAIQGLKCCMRKDGNECKVCPYTESDLCVEDMAADAFALVIERQMKIDELNEFINGFSKNATCVVKCKDCWKRGSYYDCPCHEHGFDEDDNWFCANGEKRK